MPNWRHSLPALAVAAVGVALALLLFNSLARTRLFSPDSMNYVDVARNIAAGRGAVQSAAGFNGADPPAAETPIPAPLLSQPPLYPLLVALLSLAGPPPADAALALAALAYGACLPLAFLLARELYDEQAAALAVGATLLCFPLAYVARFAWSESLGAALVLLALLLLARAARPGGAPPAWEATLAGLAAGLAFATRYALWPLLPLGLAYLAWARRGPAALAGYALGAALPAGLTLGRNLAVAGALLPRGLPSDRPLPRNLADAARELAGHYLANRAGALQLALAVLIGLALAAAAARGRRRAIVGAVAGRRALLPLWAAAYVAALVIQRSLAHFDPIGPRLIAPAWASLVVLGPALLLAAAPRLRRPPHLALAICAAAALAAAARELPVALGPPAEHGPPLASSERLRWVAEHTGPGDLIVGDDAVDLPFYLGRPAAVSFSAYPLTRHATYAGLRALAAARCDEYAHIYLVLRLWPGQARAERERAFGTFIADLKAGDAAAYPALRPLAQLSDGAAFAVECP